MITITIKYPKISGVIVHTENDLDNILNKQD